MSQFKLALFDWDGTLCDSRELAAGAMKAIFDAFSLPAPSKETYLREITPDYMGFYSKHGIPESATKDKLNKIWSYHFKNSPRAPMYRYVRELLLLCRERIEVTGIVSASLKPIIASALSEENLFNLMDYIAGGEHHKGEGIKKVANYYSAHPREVIYVDDNATSLIEAKEAGAFTIGVTHGFQSADQIRAANPHKVADSLLDVMNIIKEVTTE